MWCESCFRVPNGPSIVSAWSIDLFWQVTTNLDRFPHSRSMIEVETIGKVAEIGWSRMLVLTTFSTVSTSIVDLEGGNRSKFVVTCQNKSILQAGTILGPLSTRKHDSHHIQGPIPPLRYLLNYIASYNSSYIMSTCLYIICNSNVCKLTNAPRVKIQNRYDSL